MNVNRNLLVIFNTGLLDEDAIEQETGWLDHIYHLTESAEEFCKAHELLDRNYIHSNKKKIIKAARYFRLKPFQFFINKN